MILRPLCLIIQVNNHMKSVNIFTYGTLMFPEVIYSLIGHQKLMSCKATLKNYVRKQVKGQSYPGIIPSQGNHVEGIFYFDVSPEALQILQAYQNDEDNIEYMMKQVQVETDKGKVKAGTYVYLFPNNLQNSDWNKEYFFQTDFLHFSQKYAEME